MSKYWKAKNKVLCPFYEGEREKALVCSGVISERIQNNFNTKDDKYRHKLNYCCKNMDKCPIYSMLEDQYT